ncbi:Dynein regulatory complex subunit 3 [Diplonema papillatum]|nr:Dynein regulatory complex subunit 3 [Diplonema papillatum]
MLHADSTSERPDKPSFTVLDEALIKRCIYIPPSGAEDDKKSRDRDPGKTQKQRVEFHEVGCLIFSFTGISKIDNLAGFNVLTKLQLDNNNIRKIENLDHLSNLVWLDLSFNKITKIGGLGELRKLEDLTLHCNDIEVLEGMDHLLNLKCFSIGKNSLDNLDDIAKYLRKFKNLRMLSLAGNPCHTKMQLQIYEAKVLAHLSKLKYLDYRLVDAKAVANAKAEHREHLVQVEEQDKKEEEKQRLDHQLEQEETDYKSWNCSGMQTLFEELVTDGTEAKQIAGFRESGLYEDGEKLNDALKAYRDKFEERRRDFVTRMQEHKKVKDDEYFDFSETLSIAKQECDDECKALIKAFEKKKKRVLPRSEAQAGEEGRPADDDGAVQELAAALQSLKEALLEKETDQQEAYEAVISDFETNFMALQEETIETISDSFKKLQDCEKEYRDELEAIFEEIRTRHQAQAGEQQASVNASDRAGDWEQELNAKKTQLDSILENKEELDKLIDESHQARQQKLYALEEKRTDTEKSNCTAIVEQEKENEHQRNRARVCEIFMYCSLAQKLIKQELDDDHAYRDTEYTQTNAFVEA